METQINITETGLTKDAITAMKAANRASIHIKNREAKLCLDIPVKQGKFEASVETELITNGWVKSWYEQGYRAFFYLSSPQYCGAWQALLQILRPGDQLDLYARENGNGYLKVARCDASDFGEEAKYHGNYQGLHLDECIVRMKRKGKVVVDGLVLDFSCCPDNSARAIRPVEYRLAV